MAYEANEVIEMTAEIVSAYVGANALPLTEVADFIRQVHESLAGLAHGASAAPLVEPLKPAVPIRKSITPDRLISLEDGRPYTSLKRHLATKYGLTPQAYREKWGLPKDYPMVAPNYAASRSAMAKTSGLGRGGRTAKAAEPTAASTAMLAPLKSRSRRKKSD